MSSELTRLSREVCEVLLQQTDPADFAPAEDWIDLGTLVQAMELRGCFLMVNSTSHGGLRRIAAFHVTTAQGFPCMGSSEWGEYATVGEAVLRAAHEALINPRVGGGQP